MRWARCLLDVGWHLIEERADHPPVVWEALCGHLLPMVALHDEPSRRPCEACTARQVARAVDADRAPDGRYVARCGAEVIRASLVERGRCQLCTPQIPTQRSRTSR